MQEIKEPFNFVSFKIDKISGRIFARIFIKTAKDPDIRVDGVVLQPEIKMDEHELNAYVEKFESGTENEESCARQALKAIQEEKKSPGTHTRKKSALGF